MFFDLLRLANVGESMELLASIQQQQQQHNPKRQHIDRLQATTRRPPTGSLGGNQQAQNAQQCKPLDLSVKPDQQQQFATRLNSARTYAHTPAAVKQQLQRLTCPLSLRDDYMTTPMATQQQPPGAADAQRHRLNGNNNSNGYMMAKQQTRHQQVPSNNKLIINSSTSSPSSHSSHSSSSISPSSLSQVSSVSSEQSLLHRHPRKSALAGSSGRRSAAISSMDSQSTVLPNPSQTTTTTTTSSTRRQKHKGSKSHLCQQCGRSFSRSDMLTRHSRLHSGLKPYQCGKCLQVFSRSDHLSTHERTHTGEKPYQCQFCAYSACRRDMITRHMRTHTGGATAGQGAGRSQTPARRSGAKRKSAEGDHGGDFSETNISHSLARNSGSSPGSFQDMELA